MPKKERKGLPDVVRRSLSSNPAIKSAFDDGVKHGHGEAKAEILTYLMDEYISDEKLLRTDAEYQAALRVIKAISKKFNKK